MLSLKDFEIFTINSSRLITGGWERTGSGTKHVLMQSFDYGHDFTEGGTTKYCCVSNVSWGGDGSGACPCDS